MTIITVLSSGEEVLVSIINIRILLERNLRKMLDYIVQN